MTIHPDIFKRQTELEIEMAGLGAARFRSRTEKDISKDRGAGTQPGSFLVSSSIRPFAEAITAFVEDAYSGRPGPRNVAAKLIRDMDHGAVAYLASRAVLNRLIKGPSVALLTLARDVARSVEVEARFERFEREAPKLYAKIAGDLKEKGATENHKAMVMIYAMNKNDIPWDIWLNTERLHLGCRLVELFCEATNLATLLQAHQSSDRDAPRDQYRVELTATTYDWIEQSIGRGEERWPAYMPTIIPPKDWTELTGGGYHSHAVRPLELVRKATARQRKLLEAAHLGAVYSAINAIQRTPWKINAGVLDVMQQIAAARSTIGGMVSGRDAPLPDRPHDIDTNPDTLKEWKWKARDVYVSNIQLRRDRLQQQQLLDLCEKFRPEAAIYFPHNLDFRGRVYPVTQTLHPQGSDNVKALLTFAQGKPLGPDGSRWLAIHGANCYGVDKVAFSKRIAWVEKNKHHIWASALDPLGYQWWTEADSPWCFLAFCFEWQAYSIARQSG